MESMAGKFTEQLAGYWREKGRERGEGGREMEEGRGRGREREQRVESEVLQMKETIGTCMSI